MLTFFFQDVEKVLRRFLETLASLTVVSSFVHDSQPRSARLCGSSVLITCLAFCVLSSADVAFPPPTPSSGVGAFKTITSCGSFFFHLTFKAQGLMRS